MRIRRLHLENFKKFPMLDLELDSHFTLLVGENGAGKTSVLDALSVAAGIWLAEATDSMLDNSGRSILRSEIRLEAVTKGDRRQFVEHKPCIVRATGQIDGRDGVEWTRQIREDGSRMTDADAKAARKLVADVFARDKAGQDVLCPVLAYYGAGRTWLPSHDRVPTADGDGPARRWEAFYDCFNERIRFPRLTKWFARETTARGNNEGRWRPGAEVVRQAVVRCVPGADDVCYDPDLEQIIISIDGNTQPLGNLSAGQRMMLGLVADLAIKVVTQNAYLLPPKVLAPEDNPLPRVLAQTPGLVLIDELDVHLHPRWQRQVASDLKDIFPAIQFVCTSHSAQIIGELQRKEIRVMKGNRAEEPQVAYGADSNWILEHVMGAEERTGPATEKIAEVEDAIEEGELEQAQKGVAELKDMVGGEEGEVTRLEATIRNLEALADAED